MLLLCSGPGCSEDMAGSQAPQSMATAGDLIYRATSETTERPTEGRVDIQAAPHSGRFYPLSPAKTSKPPIDPCLGAQFMNACRGAERTWPSVLVRAMCCQPHVWLAQTASSFLYSGMEGRQLHGQRRPELQPPGRPRSSIKGRRACSDLSAQRRKLPGKRAEASQGGDGEELV